MISIFYLVAPLLIMADKNRYFYYLLPLMFFVSYMQPRGLPHESFIHFFSAYMLGMFLSRYKTEINVVISKTYMLVLLAIATIIMGALELYTQQDTMTYINFFQKLAMAVFFLGLLFRYNEKLTSFFVALIADVSFGIFFIHSYILSGGKLVYKKLFSSLPQGNLFSYLLVSLAVLLLCTYLVVGVKKIAGQRSRFIIGS